jgi:hypothetical protein
MLKLLHLIFPFLKTNTQAKYVGYYCKVINITGSDLVENKGNQLYIVLGVQAQFYL